MKRVCRLWRLFKRDLGPPKHRLLLFQKSSQIVLGGLERVPDLFSQPAQPPLGAVNRHFNPALKAVQALAMRIGAAYGRQPVLPERQMHILPGVELQGEQRVVVSQHEVGIAAFRQLRRLKQQTRQNAGLVAGLLKPRLQFKQSVGDQRARQCAASGQRHRGVLPPCGAQQFLTGMAQAAQHSLGVVQQADAGRCESDRAAAAFD